MQFKQYLFLVVLVLILSIGFGCDVNNSEESNLNTDFNKRTYSLNVPQSYDESRQYSLMFVFHGAGGTGEGIRQIAQFDSYSGWKDIIICYPNALVENWEEGCKCNKPYRLGIDDVGFVSYLIDKISAEYNIDTTKIYGVGFSQGGLFAMNLACKMSDKFAGIATVASPMSEPLYYECVPTENVSVLMIHGTNDNVLPYYGSEQGGFSLISTPQAAKFWGLQNGCNSTPIETEVIKPTTSGVGVNKIEYVNCESDIKVTLFEIVNGGHYWFTSNEFMATNEIINFFYPL